MKAMVDCPVLVSRAGWDIIGVLQSVSFEYPVSGTLVPHILSVCVCLSDVSLYSSVMGPLLNSCLKKEAHKKTKYSLPCYISSGAPVSTVIRGNFELSSSIQKIKSEKFKI